MFQKYTALLNQAKKALPYRFFFPGRIAIFIIILAFLWPGASIAKTALEIAVQVSAPAKTATTIPYDTLACFSLGMCFVLEMILLYFAVKKTGKGKSLEQEQMIQEMLINEVRSQALNAKLSALLAEQRIELKKSREIIESQSVEISVMGAVLKKDVKGNGFNVEQVEKPPILSEVIDFQTFSKIYPDKDSILKYIAQLKWAKGYSCIRCYNTTFLAGQTPYGRRCTKCGYDESATVNTIFHNSKILINKALYMLILVYNTKGLISSYKLAELLDIRQSTCWVYSSRFKKKLLENKDSLGEVDGEGWSQMVLDVGD